MQLTEQHIITKDDPRFSVLDNACFLSKNLYNATLYELRQHFFATRKSLSYETLANMMKSNPDYCALPRKVSQQVVMQACGDWSNFWASLREWLKNPHKYTGNPNYPAINIKLMDATDWCIPTKNLIL